MKRSTPVLFAAGVVGLTGVLLGALGAHALEETLDARETAAAWETAVLYHLFHAAALLAAGIWLRTESGVRFVTPAALCWAAGVVLFSGSLYLLALGGPAFLGPVTPLGGILFLAGWVLVCAAAWRDR